ncbi:hypothetical protein SNK04_013781 [Fusarium graminearum]
MHPCGPTKSSCGTAVRTRPAPANPRSAPAAVRTRSPCTVVAASAATAEPLKETAHELPRSQPARPRLPAQLHPADRRGVRGRTGRAVPQQPVPPRQGRQHQGARLLLRERVPELPPRIGPGQALHPRREGRHLAAGARPDHVAAVAAGLPAGARMRILAIDPGTEESGWCLLQGGSVLESGVIPNYELLAIVAGWNRYSEDQLAIEMIASYGMAVGREVFETCVWVGRFVQAWHQPNAVRLVYRRDVKLHLCGNAKAKDANIRQALLDLLGPQGTKKARGRPTASSHMHGPRSVWP